MPKPQRPEISRESKKTIKKTAWYGRTYCRSLFVSVGSASPPLVLSTACRGMEKLDSAGALREYWAAKLEYGRGKLDNNREVGMERLVVRLEGAVAGLAASVVRQTGSEVRLRRWLCFHTSASAGTRAAAGTGRKRVHVQQLLFF
ncbi:hypothetical protein C6I21_01340 [Alkalicoccus urumqiensis]|uniref:Uncharacterized protein n=1 Tax=Alkalicoccus urumqiensis TaxID=1548213 RepID=A0A2P6MLT1_ALKUR|nr:hypothetical protein C6I21_01340 [Alkalicoccus urumqiensis]